MTKHRFRQAGRSVLAISGTVLGLLALACPTPAQDKQVTTVSPLYEEPLYLFNTNEFFIDVFGAVANADTFEIGDAFGGGLGVGYFFTRYTGVYAEGWIIDAADQDGAALGGVMLRLPMDDFCTALYAFAEYGGTFGEESEPSFQFGAGFDIRLTDQTSFFFDARSMQNRHTSLDNGELFRFGLRFIF